MVLSTYVWRYETLRTSNLLSVNLLLIQAKQPPETNLKGIHRLTRLKHNKDCKSNPDDSNNS